MRLTDKQWEKIQDLVPDGPVRSDGKGRPWRDLPKDYPPYQTCHRRFQQWVQDGVFDQVIEALAKDLQQRGDIDMSECFIDGTFSLAKKGGYLWERLSAVKAPRSWQSRMLVVLFYLSRSSLQALMKSR